MSTPQITLLQDWTKRRDWLLLNECDMPPEHRDDCRAVLTLLIETHAQNAAAAQPCPNPFRPEWRPARRELVIHDHSHGQIVPVVRNETESRERIQNVLQRLKKLDLQSSTRVPESNILSPATPLAGSTVLSDRERKEEERPQPPAAAKAPPQRPVLHPLPVWAEIEAAISQPWTSRWIVYQRIESALNQRKALPQKALEFLQTRAASSSVDACVAAEFLLRCGGEEAMKAALRAWKDRLRNQGADYIVQRLRLVLQNNDTQATAVKLIRAELGGDHSLFRLELLALLGGLGTLEDAGYIFDLLRLPRSSDEHPQERAAMLQALRSIAQNGRFQEKADSQPNAAASATGPAQ
ncbi:MAG TPA: hypothetical protein VEJ63_10010 [Planctomycetota bacterium]|nr:hypothetical protein [Planctomycetota bacterium]